MLFHHNLPHHIQLLTFHFMFNLLLVQALDIQFVEKNNGNNGPKILKIGVSNKKMLPTPEFHTLLHFNLDQQLNLLEWLKWFQLQETQLSHLNQQLLHQQHRSHSMCNLLLLQWQVIQLEEKRTGKLGLKILKTGETIKLIWLTQESHMLLLFNLENQLD